MPEKFIINGGKKLQGEIEVMGSKNSALSILAASLLTKETCVIDNLPLIEDIFKFIAVLERMGAKTEWLTERKIKIQCSNIDVKKMPNDLLKFFRGAVLFWGVLLSRFDNFQTKAPGGCVIGARPLDTHLDAFNQMGAEVKNSGKLFVFKKNLNVFNSRKTQEIVLDEFSVTATENVLLLASSQNKKTILKIADTDYQVQELIKVLEKMGAKIKTTGPHIFEIDGSCKLKGFDCELIGDPIEAGTFIIAILATKGSVLVKNVETDYLTLFLKRLKKAGANLEFPDKRSIRVLPSPKLVLDKIQSLPYPGIHTDFQPQFGVLATQTKGATIIHDPLYEGRLKYLEELNKMGADIVFCDPHRAIVSGPKKLKGITVPSLDLRAGAALIIAGLIARGKTIINDVYQIDRGYEKIEERLNNLGADIKRVTA